MAAMPLLRYEEEEAGDWVESKTDDLASWLRPHPPRVVPADLARHAALDAWLPMFEGTPVAPGAMPALLSEPQSALHALMYLGENWDGEGAKAVGPETVTHAESALRFLRVPDISPEVTACPDGSVDLQWKTGRLQLLVNIEGPHGDFYGETHSGLTLKGTFTDVKDLGALKGVLAGAG